VTGGPAYGSLIGNALERGGGDGPLGERGAHMTALELVLAGGEVVHTGFDRFAGASTARLSRTGVGPSLSGLIAQSNFGVVTRATFWLARRPAEEAGLTLMGETPEMAAVYEEVRRSIVDEAERGGARGVDADFLAAACIGVAREVGQKMLARRPIDTAAATDFAVALILGGTAGLSGAAP
jgi:hypothetical protein